MNDTVLKTPIALHSSYDYHRRIMAFIGHSVACQILYERSTWRSQRNYAR